MSLLLLVAAGALALQESPPERVDLLGLVDPWQDSVRGVWRLTSKGLHVPGGPFDRIVIPYVPPEEYDVTAVVERQGRTNALNLGLAVGEVQFQVILDAFVNGAFVSGLDLVDGSPFYKNETKREGELFVEGKPRTVVCSVRKDRVTVVVDGKKIIDWKLDRKRLSLYSKWKLPRKDCLFVGSWTGASRIRALELTVIKGRGELIRKPTPRIVARPAPEPERLDDLFRRLDSPRYKERQAAEEELALVPVQWLPFLRRRADETGSEEVKFRVGALSVPDGWTKLLVGTIAEARETLAVLGADVPERNEVLGRVFSRLRSLPPREAASCLDDLLVEQDPAVLDFVLRGLSVHPGKERDRLVELLRNPRTAVRAADALIAAGDGSVVPQALVIYAMEGKVVPREAGRVLEFFGPGGDVGPVLEVVRDRRRALQGTVALRILELAEAPRGEKALLALMKENHWRSGEIVTSLAVIGGETALHVARALGAEEARYVLRDPEWARERLVAARKLPSDRTLNRRAVAQIAAAGGSTLRDKVYAWLREEGLRIDTQRALLPLLGAVGRLEDGDLVEKMLDHSLLAEAAAEALEMMGDPARAGAIAAAWKRLEWNASLERAVLSVPAEAVEEELVAVLADPSAHSMKIGAALKLAEKRPSPRVREALYRSLADRGKLSSEFRAGATRLLAAGARKEDGPFIRRLRAGKDASLRVTGHLLALRAGDASAAMDLAKSLSSKGRAELSYRVLLQKSGALSLMDGAAPAGEVWRKAVLARWREAPDWAEGAIWLAGRGEAEAAEAVMERVDSYGPELRSLAERTLGARGNGAMLDRIVGKAFANTRLSPEEERAVAAGSGPDLRARIIAEARRRGVRTTDPVLMLAVALGDPSAAPLYRRVVSLHRGVMSRASAGDPTTVACVRAVGRIGAKEAVIDLRRALRSANSSVRAAAAGALGELRDREAMAYLVRLVDDPHKVDGEDPRVWHAAMEALEAITGKKAAGASVTERRAWWKAR